MSYFAKTTFLILLLGAVAGFLNGLLGAGGGIPLVLGLSLLWGKKAANGKRFFTTALAVMLPLSLYSVRRYGDALPLDGVQIFVIALPSFVGGAVGAWLLGRLPISALNRIFATVTALSGVFLLF